MLHRLLSRRHHLEHPQATTPQSILIIVLGINFLEGLECFYGVIEMTHLVTIVRDQLRQVVRICWCFSVYVNLPRILSLPVHYISPNQPFYISLLRFVLLTPHSQKTSLSLLVITSRRTSQSIVPVELILSLEITLDTVEVNQHVIELLEQEETTCHTLATRNRITFGSWCSH